MSITAPPTTMDEQYELQTHRAEETHWWYVGRRQVIDAILQGVPLPPDPRILDAGCGSGRNMVELARYGQVTGIELAAASVAAARARGVGEVIHGSVYELPFAAGSFDLAVSFDVIEHLDDDRLALRELHRVVRGDGRLIVTVPAYPWLWSSHDRVNRHRRRYTRATLLAATADAGWRTSRITYFNALLLPAAVAARGVQRLRRPIEPPISDLERTPRALNRLLGAPLALEARLLARGGRIPAGLSLAAVLDHAP
jgi:SAM-dependent methyltransferase